MEKKTFKEKLLTESISLLKIFVISFLLVSLLTTFVIKPVKVVGDSMYPTLHNHDNGFSSVITKLTRGIRRFDIVVVYLPTDKKYIVKRVIALPNETVSYENNQLFINNSPLAEPFLDEKYMQEVTKEGSNFTKNFDPLTLKSDEYFLLGDNRPFSLDSMYYGPFKENQIISIGVFVLFQLPIR